jgi:5'-3' exonuclease
MGVPGFFAWLLKNNTHNNIILHSLQNINALYFDANCLFHPKCFDILKLYSQETNIDRLEDLMIKRIIKYIDYIINFVKPSELIYIAVDGVAPVAKINQQRKRRYKSVIDNEFITELNKKYNKNKNNNWSNIVITPGTDFMIKLDNSLNEYIKTIKNVKVIYSSYKECGEGEHKIIRYIKNNENKNKHIHVIYGLDADLIFLAMSAYNKFNEIYLLREFNHVKSIKHEITEDVNEKLCYLSIENVINTYNEYILNKLMDNADILDINFEETYFDFSKDFIILCFLLGNDFIPTLPSINIRNYGIEYITEAYCKMFCYTQTYLYDIINNKININNLKLIFDYLKDIEHEYFTQTFPNYIKKIKHKKYNGNDKYEEEIFNRDNLINISKEDHIKLGIETIDVYKFRYYEHNFNSRINQQKMINKICTNYIDMIQWICRYYFEINMPSWRFYYQFNNAPFASDIFDYLDNFIEHNDDYVYNILYEEALPIESQLICIIPPQHNNIFNKKIKDKYNKIYKSDMTRFMLPIKVEIEYDREQYWMCEPKLPILDINLIY